MRRALAFLTPLGGGVVPDGRTLSWFPAVGALMGAALGAIWWGAEQLWPPLVAAAIVIVADLALTGLLHVDGLVDAADGLLPQVVTRERRLELMAEPTVGAYGVAVLGVVLLLRCTALASMEPNVLLIVGIWCGARTAMAVAARAVPYARAEGGLATALLGGDWRAVGSLGVVGALSLALAADGAAASLAVAVGLVASGLVVWFGLRRLGGFTGDVLGAAGVVGETVALVVAGGTMVMAAGQRATAVALGLLADGLLGEPPGSVHPVAGFGRAMQAVEQLTYEDSRLAGVVHAAAGAALGAAAGATVGSTAVATYVAVARRALGDAALSVGDALDAGDLERARMRLPALVGRDPSQLDEHDIARAAVESVAENTVDAVVAPALWALAAGAPGVLAHRAVNTMDAMVGHHSDRYERYGWATARLDDGAAWLPARTTAALVAACRPRSSPAVWRAVRRDAPAHPSPNSGVAESAFAAALGLRLGGESRYGDRIERRPSLGDGRPPDGADIARAVDLSRDVTIALVTVLLAAGLGGRLRGRRR